MGGDDLVLIGKVIGAHGIKGMLRVYAYAQSPHCFSTGHDLVLDCARDGRRYFEVTVAQSYKNIVRLGLKDVCTRDAAEALTGCRVYMAKAMLPPLEQDTYYWIDLIGLPVFTREGDLLGRIEEIIPTGANDVYVVRSREGAGKREVLIPAIASVILEVDLDQGRMRVELPDGLLD
jgi:16S rRNA processing protein RimM